MPGEVSVDWDKLLAIDGPDAAVRQAAIFVFIQSSIALGWVIAGLFFNMMSDRLGGLAVWSSAFGTQAVAGNIYRCVAAMLFLTFGLATKTLLVVGISGMQERVSDLTMTGLIRQLSGSQFVKGQVVRGLFNGVFQIVGWSLLGVAVGGR